MTKVSPNLEGAIVAAIHCMREAQKVLGANAARDRRRGRLSPSSAMAEALERAAAAMYEALDCDQGRKPWVECPLCWERVRTLEAHQESCRERQATQSDRTI